MHCTTAFELSATTELSCDRILPVLTAKEVFTQKVVGYRYLVELASKQVELQEDRAVPVSTKVIDIVVTQPSKEEIASLIAACSWLKGYSIVSYHEPSFESAPF